MIVRPKPNSVSLFFILRGSIVPVIAPRVLSIATFSFLVVLLNHREPGLLKEVSVAPFTMLGLSLSIFLGFRNNACYDRWWEARRLWGQLIYEMRSIGRDTVLLVPGDAARHRQLCRLIGFTHVLAARLRGESAAAALAPWISAEEFQEIQDRRNLGNAVLHKVHSEYASCLRDGTMTDILFQSFSSHLSTISGVQAGCERIHSTPLPFAYTLLVHRTAVLFCVFLPFALVTCFGWYTPLATAVIAYAFFGLDALGNELEDPFGISQNALPLRTMTRTIEVDLLELLGVEDVAQYLEPLDFVLD